MRQIRPRLTQDQQPSHNTFAVAIRMNRNIAGILHQESLQAFVATFYKERQQDNQQVE